MKLTKSRLQQIIKEEINNLGEGWWPFGGDKKKKAAPQAATEAEPVGVQTKEEFVDAWVGSSEMGGHGFKPEQIEDFMGRYADKYQKDLDKNGIPRIYGVWGMPKSLGGRKDGEYHVDSMKFELDSAADSYSGEEDEKDQSSARSSADHRDYRRQPGESAYERSTRTNRGSSGRHSWEESIQRKPRKRRKKK